jgi:hypothetical protein
MTNNEILPSSFADFHAYTIIIRFTEIHNKKWGAEVVNA